MGNPTSLSVQSVLPTDPKSRDGEYRAGMARTTAICKHCGSLIYIPETGTIQDFVCPRCHGQLRESVEEKTLIGHADPIQSSCPQCEAILHIPPAFTGKHVFCVACGCRLMVTLTVQIDSGPRLFTQRPAKEPPLSEDRTEADDEMIRVTCRCGKRLKADPTAAGRTTACPRCGFPVTFSDTPTEGDGVTPSDVGCQPKASASPTSTRTPPCPPLSPHEAAIAARDHTIDAALQCLVYGSPSPHCQPAELQEDDASLFLCIAHATWLWPAVVVIMATCIMATLLKTFVIGF